MVRLANGGLVHGFHDLSLLIIDRCRENNPNLDARAVIVALRDGNHAQLDAWCAGPMWSDIKADLAELRSGK
jgi:hypothetical protein